MSHLPSVLPASLIAAPFQDPPELDREAAARCIEACQEAADAAASCAEACLAGAPVDEVDRTLQVHLDSADVCRTTARILSRQVEPDAEVLCRQLAACAAAAGLCAHECDDGARTAESPTCAEACRRAAESCRRLAEALEDQATGYAGP